MKRLTIAAVVFWMLGFVSASVEAGSYTYTLIAQTGATFTNLDTAPTLNNVGTVAFHATYTAGGDGIFVGGVGSITTIADTSGTLTSFGGTSINDSGTVAFTAAYTTNIWSGCSGDFNVSGIFIGNGSNSTSVYVGIGGPTVICGGYYYPAFYGFGSPTINNEGTIAFAAAIRNYTGVAYNGGILTGNGGPITTIFAANSYLGPYGTAINTAGAVTFAYFPNCCPPSGGEVFQAVGDSLIFIGSTSPLGATPTINNSRRVAFLVGDASYSGPATSIVVGTGGSATTIAVTNVAFSAFGNAVCINDTGSVAFYASLGTGGAGIFTGPNKESNKVITVGDALFGSTVSNLSLSTHALNNPGAVAFSANLADGRQVIARADPVLPTRHVEIELVNADVVLTFDTTSNAACSVQTTTDLLSGAWNTIASNITGNGSVATNIHTAGAAVPQRFYRVGMCPVQPAVLAVDNAADPPYTNGWNNGSSGGIGFGAWMLTATGGMSSSSNGFFVGSSVNNAWGASPGIDTAGKSWGVYANSNNITAAYRAFAAPLPVGGTFRLDMDNGLIDGGNSVGFVLRNGNASSSAGDYNVGARFEFLFLGGSSSYAVVDAAGYQPIGVPFTGTGLRLVFTLNTANTYTLLTIDNASNATNTFTGTLAGSGTVDSLALYNRNAGSNSDHDAFFNSLQIISP